MAFAFELCETGAVKILIVEDEAPAARRLRRLVADILAVDAQEIAIADTIDEAFAALADRAFDLLLLDLDLAGRDGFALLRGACAGRLATIIVSANIDRAIEAFDHDVVDFVAKPVLLERLKRALSRAADARKDDFHVMVRAPGRVEIIDARSIIRISGAGDYVEIIAKAGRRFLHHEKLDALERRLPKSFVRTHRSHIVNTERVARLRASGGKHFAVSEDDVETPVSRRRLRTVRDALRSLVADPTGSRSYAPS